MPVLNINNVESREITIQVFGLGYVGLPLAVKLASAGFSVAGIDKDKSKIERLKQKKLLDSEKFLEKDYVSCIDRTLRVLSGISKDDKQKIGIICVPTPIPTDNIQSDIYVKDATEDFLENAKKGDIIILESSIEVGTTEKIKKIIEKNGFIVGKNFGLAFCPERIDPQNKKWHLENIPRIIYCSDDNTYKICEQIYQNINHANLKRVSNPKVAEIVKSFENTFRLVNISLVNELAILCDKIKIDVNEVIDAAATKPFGFMPFYPGAGAGGHCIPKDPRFLLHSAKKLGLKYTTIEDALEINSQMPKYIAESIKKIISEKKLSRSVIVCGLTYKPDIEDMRDTPGFKILKELRHTNVKIAAYDPYFKQELLNKYRVENQLKDIEFDILESLDEKSISQFGCICVVQNHKKTEYSLQKIYEDEKIPFIYDCQNKIRQNQKSKTILVKLGSG